MALTYTREGGEPMAVASRARRGKPGGTRRRLDFKRLIAYLGRMNAMIDTLKTSKAFEGAGFAKAQAETLASTIAEATSASREDLVTKDYLKVEIAGLKNDILRWMLGSQVMLVVVLAALANFTKLPG